MNKLKFEFTVEEVNIIMAALVKMPFETVAQLVGNVQQQVQPQLQQQKDSQTVPGSDLPRAK